MFISPAFASDAVEAASEPNALISFIPLLIVFVIFYLMVIKPQNKRIKDHRGMVSNLRKGDKIVTQGGLLAVVKKLVGEDEVLLELSKGVEVTALRNSIMSTRSLSAPEPEDAKVKAKAKTDVKPAPKAKTKAKAVKK